MHAGIMKLGMEQTVRCECGKVHGTHRVGLDQNLETYPIWRLQSPPDVGFYLEGSFSQPRCTACGEKVLVRE